MTRFLLSLLFISCLVAPTIVCADDEPATPVDDYLCYFTETPPTIDGRGDDEAWQRAQPIDDFTIPGSDQRPAATRARLLWDREYVYFFAELEDRDLFADVEEHDGNLWTNDVFELFFKPSEEKAGYYEFEVSPANVTFDIFWPLKELDDIEKYRAHDEFDFQTAVQREGTIDVRDDQDRGWTCEGRIAWRDFSRCGGRPLPDERWKFNLARCDYTQGNPKAELSSTAHSKTLINAVFHDDRDYGSIRFVAPKESPRPAGAKPFGLDKVERLTTSRVLGSPDPPKPYRVERIFEKLPLTMPVVLRKQPDSDFIWVVTQRTAYGDTTLGRFRNESDVAELEPLLPPSPGELMTDICFHPQFADNGYLYVGHCGMFGREEKYARITRYHIDPRPPYKFESDSATTIIEWRSDGHNGMAIAFGPDGMMYVTTGDGTSDSDTNIVGQSTLPLTSKLLRLDVDHAEPGQTYRVPDDNPFVDNKDFAPETYAYGLRNPWRLSIDPSNGQIWIGNNGQDLWESIYLVERGANYGWSIMEGGHPFYLDRQPGPTPISKPVADHPHSEARSLTGGFVYHGSKFPQLDGAYLYGDYATGKIWAIKHDGQQVTYHEEIADTPLQITAFIPGNDGDIWVTDHGGKGLYRLIETPIDEPQPPFPMRLSESGLFKDVASHAMTDGVIPYSVNSPLWSDGAYKERFLAIPFKEGEDRRIDFKPSGGWGFPNDTVLVKSFALERIAGDPTSRHWIETRFLVRQQNEWVGYSYEWNDEQTDATLVTGDGQDRVFEIRDPAAADGLQQQTWHYPSRTECMVCHSRAANYVLGLQTAQMNRDHDYGSIVDNQLRALEHADLFRVNWGSESYVSYLIELVDRGRKGAGEKADDRKVRADITANVRKFLSERLFSGDQRKMSSDTALLTRDPDDYARLADPADRTASLDARARSYLHANCAQCHVHGGGGNAKMNLAIDVAPDEMNILDEKPMHHSYGIPDARLVAPGDPDRSVLLHRIAIRGPGQMPQLATSIVDNQAVELIRAWIASLKTVTK